MDQTQSGDNVWIRCGQGLFHVQSIPKFLAHNAEQCVQDVARVQKRMSRDLFRKSRVCLDTQAIGRTATWQEPADSCTCRGTTHAINFKETTREKDPEERGESDKSAIVKPLLTLEHKQRLEMMIPST